jgi:hypothetical protein
MISLKKPQTFYISSLFTLIILAVVCIAISAVDIIIQALTQKTTAGYFDHRNLIVVGGSYVLLVKATPMYYKVGFI